MNHKKYSFSPIMRNMSTGHTVRLFTLEQPSTPPRESKASPKARPNVATLGEDPGDRSNLKAGEQSHPEAYVPKARHTIRYLNCGSPVGLMTSTCETCLSDPFKDRRGNRRTSFRKTFMYDGLIATIHNISRGGIQIKTNAVLRIGQELKIGFSLDGGMVKVRGTIVYVQSLSHGKMLAGIEFSELSEKDSELLNRFLNSCSPDIAQR